MTKHTEVSMVNGLLKSQALPGLAGLRASLTEEREWALI